MHWAFWLHHSLEEWKTCKEKAPIAYRGVNAVSRTKFLMALLMKDPLSHW